MLAKSLSCCNNHLLWINNLGVQSLEEKVSCYMGEE